jgi:riboflavin synthase
MFTGIIQGIGIVNSVEKKGDWKILIETQLLNLDKAQIGASIACDGVCLTMVEKGPSWFVVDVSPETLGKTSISHWAEGTKVNLERPLRLGDELGGHLVSGHVDGVVAVKEIKRDQDSHILNIAFPENSPLHPPVRTGGDFTQDSPRVRGDIRGENCGYVLDMACFIAPKGSVTLDGVSLTVNDVTKDHFTVNIIPHTWTHTTMGLKKPGDALNLEIDMLVRYVANILGKQAA